MGATVRLFDGSIVDITDQEWPEVCSPKQASLIAEDNLVHSLTVRKHADGRTLIYGSHQLRTLAGENIDTRGIIMSRNGDVKQAIADVAKNMQLSGWLAEQCTHAIIRR